MFEKAGILGSQVTLNVLLFVPLGFLLPLVFPDKFNRFWKVALCALCTWKKLCTAQIPLAKWRTVCTGLALLLSICVPAAIDIASTHSKYGLLRDATSKIPENTILNIPLSEKTGEVPLCSYDGDYLQTLRSVLAALEIKPETEEALQVHAWGGASYIGQSRNREIGVCVGVNTIRMKWTQLPKRHPHMRCRGGARN